MDYAQSLSTSRQTAGRALLRLSATAACVLALAPIAQAQVTSLYSFTNGSDGAQPVAGLIQASDGNLYGTTSGGGGLFSSPSDHGTVFQFSLTSGTLTTLYAFTGGSDGAYPLGGLIQTGNGNLFGTTLKGGATGHGAVFQIATGDTFSTLYSFGPSSIGITDGVEPAAGLLQASDGNFYGTTYYGGDYGASGTVFQITPSGTKTTIVDFVDGQSGPDIGAFPQSSLIQASDGNLYGTTSGGGAVGAGAIYQITPSSSGGFRNTGADGTLYSFQDGSDGAYPLGGLIQASDGNLYGTTAGDGSTTYGTVYRLSLPMLTSLQPGSATVGGKTVKLVVNGFNFVKGAKVYWNGTALTTTYVKSTKLEGSVPASDIAATGTASITVTNPGSAVSGALIFTIDNPKPALSSITPSSVTHGSAAVTIAVAGSNFVSGSVVQWVAGGTTTNLSTSFSSSTKLTATVSSALIAKKGTAKVQVSTPTPGGGTSVGKTFTIK